MADSVRRNDKSHETLIECMRPWQVVVLLCVFVLIGIILIAVGVFSGPSPYYVDKNWSNTTYSAIYTGDNYFEIVYDQLKGLNGEFFFTTELTNLRAESEWFGKDDVEMSVQLSARDSDEDDWETLVSDDFVATRILECPQNQTQCNALLVMHESFIDHKQYKIAFRFLNMAKFYHDEHLGPIQTNFVYGNESYAIYSIVWRFVFLIVDLILLATLFLAFLRLRLSFRTFSLEQSWTVILLLGLLFYNNPFYALIYASPSWFFSFINILFELSYVCLFLLALLTITHANVLEKRELTFSKFFLPKFVLVSFIWLFLTISFSYTSKLEYDDPSSVVSADYRFNDFVRYIGLGLFAFYIVWLLYIILKGLEKTAAKRSGRVFNFFFILCFMAVLLAVACVAYIMIGYTENNAGTFMSFFVVFNLFTYTLAIAFLPIRRLSLSASDSAGIINQRDENESGDDMEMETEQQDEE